VNDAEGGAEATSRPLARLLAYAVKKFCGAKEAEGLSTAYLHDIDVLLGDLAENFQCPMIVRSDESLPDSVAVHNSLFIYTLLICFADRREKLIARNHWHVSIGMNLAGRLPRNCRRMTGWRWSRPLLRLGSNPSEAENHTRNNFP